jgi:hypothetical protein
MDKKLSKKFEEVREREAEKKRWRVGRRFLVGFSG